ncbi:MAG: DNA methyltransferase [Halarcobacter sp.]
MSANETTLLNRIINYMSISGKNQLHLNDFYKRFNDIKPSTIRGRINEAVGTKLMRINRGTYVLISQDAKALIEEGNTLYLIPQIIKACLYYDMLFLDIPYSTGGQKSGNRSIIDYNLITPEQFEKIIVEIQKMLKTEDSQLYFMMAGGKSSARDAMKYFDKFKKTSLIDTAQGSFTKLTKNGKQANMGKYPMPPEKIHIFTHSGKIVNQEELELDFRLERAPLPKQGGYPTAKPLELLKRIVKQSTKKGDLVGDFFAGSGITLEACLQLERACHVIDIADESIRRMKEIVKKYLDSAVTDVTLQKTISPKLQQSFLFT